MITLRRELRKKILAILNNHIRYFQSNGDGITLGQISDEIADEILAMLFKDRK